MYAIKRTRFFERSLKPYFKNHSIVHQDIEDLLQSIQNNPRIGRQFPGFGDHLVFKIRFKPSKGNKGKSHSFRLIYFVHKNSQTIVPLLFYRKNQYKKEAQILNRIKEALSEMIRAGF